MSEATDINQQKMMREATLGFFTLIVLLGILAFSIYAKATGMFTTRPSADIHPARLVELQPDGSFVAQERKPLLVELPDEETNTLVDLQDMKRVSAEQLFGRPETRVADAGDVVSKSSNEVVAEGPILDEIPDRSASERSETGNTDEAENLVGPAITPPGRLPSPVSGGSGSLTDSSETDNHLPVAQLPGTLPQKLPSWNLSDVDPIANDAAATDPPVVANPSAANQTMGTPKVPQPLPGQFPTLQESAPSFYDQARREESPAASLPNTLRSPNSLPPPETLSPPVVLNQPELPAKEEAATEGAGEATAVDDTQDELRPEGVEGAGLISPLNLEPAVARAGFEQPVDPQSPAMPQVQMAKEPVAVSDPAMETAVEEGHFQQSLESLPPALPAGFPSSLSMPVPVANTDGGQSSHVVQVAEDAPSTEADQPNPVNQANTDPALEMSANRNEASTSMAAEIDQQQVLAESLKKAERLQEPALLKPVDLEGVIDQVVGRHQETSPAAQPDALPSDAVSPGVEDPRATDSGPQNLMEQIPGRQPAVTYDRETIRRSLRKIELGPGESLTVLAQRIYGQAGWEQALFQFNRQRATTSGQFASGTLILFLPKPMMRYLYPSLAPPESTGVAPVEYQQPVPQAVVPSSETPPSKDAMIYQTRGGETLFGLAAEYLGQASRYTELLQRNQQVLQGRWGHADPLPAGLQLTFPMD